jgi:hypothetical protein
MSQGVWLETLNWVEAKSRFDADAVVSELVAGLSASFPEALAAGRN